MTHGWLIINKPVGMSSAHVVRNVKTLTKAKKVGHAGTLDPLASGVLPIALGEATKLIDYVVSDRKEYRFAVQFGKSTDTDDAEGKVIATSEHLVTEKALQAILSLFQGEIQQIPPIYSAIKLEGRRAYALAREGKEVNLEPRTVTIHALHLTKWDEKAQKAVFEVECSKGTYIRSLGRDMAISLGSVGFICSLHRMSVGKFSEACAISLAKWKEMVHNACANFGIMDMNVVLDDIPDLFLTADQVTHLRFGRAIGLDSSLSNSKRKLHQALFGHELIALGQLENGMFIPKRVFNYQT